MFGSNLQRLATKPTEVGAPHPKVTVFQSNALEYRIRSVALKVIGCFVRRKSARGAEKLV
jgi:hypothetical protein